MCIRTTCHIFRVLSNGELLGGENLPELHVHVARCQFTKNDFIAHEYLLNHTIIIDVSLWCFHQIMSFLTLFSPPPLW